MGTTVTTNLGLIKPDTAESIEANMPTFAGWASQNAANCDVVDGLFRNTQHTWSPSWTAATLNPTLGAGGFIEGKYMRIFPRMVIGYLRISLGGAGFATGTGSYSITLPVAMDASLNTMQDEFPVGKAIFYDDSAVATSSVFNVMFTPPTGLLTFRPPLGQLWSSTNPVVPAQLDRLSAMFMYPTSAA